MKAVDVKEGTVVKIEGKKYARYIGVIENRVLLYNGRRSISQANVRLYITDGWVLRETETKRILISKLKEVK